MSIQTKISGTWRTVTQPWIKVDNVQKKATKVYVKLNDAWVETWPLQPGPVGSATTTTIYRNDRIEIDVDWTAPTTGEAAAKYIVTVQIGTASTGPFVYTYTTTITAPTTALTLTNGGNGYHTFAGKKAYATITAQSAAGRNGISVAAPAVTIIQLPAPPTPTSYTLSINDCKATHTWANDSGRRVDGVELSVQFESGTAVVQKYADTVKTSTLDSWNPATIGAGTVTGKVRTYGPGGVSAWRTVTGEMPGPVKVSGYRFLNGKIRMDVSGISPTVAVYYTDSVTPATWVSDGNRGSAAEAIAVQDSVNWPRTLNKQWRILLRPINTANGWQGRDQILPWLTKIPDPIIVQPINSNTRRAGVWRNDVSEWQGSSTSGQNTAYGFYGGEFWANYRDNVIGYRVNVSTAQILLIRELSGGAAGAVRPRLMVHRANTQAGDLSHAGAYDSTALSRGEAAWCALPADWAEFLLQASHEYRGVGLFHSNTALVGGVSAEYMILKAYGHGSAGGQPVFTVRIYHDG